MVLSCGEWLRLDRLLDQQPYEDLLGLPEHVVGEIVAGELVVSPRPAPRHAVAASALGGELGPPRPVPAAAASNKSPTTLLIC